jgi:hypothetical protein
MTRRLAGANDLHPLVTLDRAVLAFFGGLLGHMNGAATDQGAARRTRGEFRKGHTDRHKRALFSFP